MKTPKEIIEYRNRVIELLKWAQDEEFITKEQYEDIKAELYNIELEMYPKKTVRDENGWEQFESEYIYGLPIDEWE